MRTRRQFTPFLDRLPYRITPGDITSIQSVVPDTGAGSDDGSDDGSCANPTTTAQPAPLPPSSGTS